MKHASPEGWLSFGGVSVIHGVTLVVMSDSIYGGH